jgi:quercetin dioxygenase-like cupin family protein
MTNTKERSGVMGELKVTKLDRARAGADQATDLYRNRERYFDGDVTSQTLVGAAESGEVELLAVFFPVGGRTRPHIHERDQVLHFVEGRGIVATAEEKIHTSAGDVVTVPAGVWHWHGASRDAAACHISIKQPGPTNWNVEEGAWANGYDE